MGCLPPLSAPKALRRFLYDFMMLILPESFEKFDRLHVSACMSVHRHVNIQTTKSPRSCTNVPLPQHPPNCAHVLWHLLSKGTPHD